MPGCIPGLVRMWAFFYIQRGAGKGLLVGDVMCFLPLGETNVVDCSLAGVREKPAAWATNLCVFSDLVSISSETQVDGRGWWG